MARIRTIKPELPHSETLGKVSRDARLLFINFFTVADDEGRLRGNSRLLASLLYPFDRDAEGLIDVWMSELSTIGAIRVYEVDGTTYVDIPKWLDHQKIDRPSKSRLPAYSRQFEKPRESSSADLGPSTLDLGPTPIAPKGAAYTDEFLKFWEAYPNKVGKDAAWRAWKKRADRPPIENILAAVDTYVRTKPSDREWCNPATWINQGRWADAPPQATTTTTTADVTTLADPRWKLRVTSWRNGYRWEHSLWGPAPDEPGCQAPKELHGPRPALGESLKVATSENA
jgi:hypothetical protein